MEREQKIKEISKRRPKITEIREPEGPGGKEVHVDLVS